MDLSEQPKGKFRRHPWEIVRASFFSRLLISARLNKTPQKVLDVGAGDAWLAGELLKIFHPGTKWICWDKDYAGQKDRILFTATRPKEDFTLLLLLDCLEHVENDADFLASLVEGNLAPGGRFLISVPAWKILYSRHDAALKHWRRYSPRECSKLLKRAGLEIEFCGGLFHSLIFPRVLVKLKDKILSPPLSDPKPLLWRYGNFTGWMAEKILLCDSAFSLLFFKSGINVPGLSWWALCKKSF